MSSETDQGAHKARALGLANLGIASLAAGDCETARRAWREALDCAEQHLPGNTIIPWIRSGFADALLRSGDHQAALEMASSALAYCASVRAPLAALTMAASLLRLGDVARAREYARQACQLRGEAVLKVFSPADRKALDLATPS